MSSIGNREIIQEYVDGNGRTKEGGDTIRYIIEYRNSFDNSPTWKLCRNEKEYTYYMEHGAFVEPFLLWTRKEPTRTYPTTINPRAPLTEKYREKTALEAALATEEALPKCATCGAVDKDEWDRHDKESEFYSHDFIAEEAEPNPIDNLSEAVKALAERAGEQVSIDRFGEPYYNTKPEVDIAKNWEPVPGASGSLEGEVETVLGWLAKVGYDTFVGFGSGQFVIQPFHHLNETEHDTLLFEVRGDTLHEALSQAVCAWYEATRNEEAK